MGRWVLLLCLRRRRRPRWREEDYHCQHQHPRKHQLNSLPRHHLRQLPLPPPAPSPLLLSPSQPQLPSPKPRSWPNLSSFTTTTMTISSVVSESTKLLEIPTQTTTRSRPPRRVHPNPPQPQPTQPIPTLPPSNEPTGSPSLDLSHHLLPHPNPLFLFPLNPPPPDALAPTLVRPPALAHPLLPPPPPWVDWSLSPAPPYPPSRIFFAWTRPTRLWRSRERRRLLGG